MSSDSPNRGSGESPGLHLCCKTVSVTKKTEWDWREWGGKNPFYGVLSDPMYLDANLNDEARKEFFLTGERQHRFWVYAALFLDSLWPSFRVRPCMTRATLALA